MHAVQNANMEPTEEIRHLTAVMGPYKSALRSQLKD